MFIALLLVTFVISVAVSTLVVRLFRSPLAAIFERLVGEALAFAWRRYIEFATYVVGLSGGVSVWELERYTTGRPRPSGGGTLVLNRDRWVLEIYRTVIETLQSIAWMLLVVFVFALVAFVIMRGFELRQGGRPRAEDRETAV